MALDYDQINAVTRRYFAKDLADNVFVATPELRRFKENCLKLIDGGSDIGQPLEYASGVFEWFSGAQTLSTADSDVFTKAVYNWRQATAPVTISRLDEIKNMGAAQVIDFVEAKVKNAKKTMSQNMSSGIFNAGTDPLAIVGLRAIVDAGSTIGGISQTNYSWWRAQEDTSTTTTSLAALENLYLLCSEDTEKPTVGFTTKTIFGRIWGLMQPQQRFADEKSADAGWDSLLLNGTPMLACSNAPANHFFWINENYIHLYTHKEENMRFEEFQVPLNQMIKSGRIVWAGALGSSNNRYHGKLEALTA